MEEGSDKEEQDSLNSELQGRNKGKTKQESSLKNQQEEEAGDSNSKERAEHDTNCKDQYPQRRQRVNSSRDHRF